MAVAHRCPPSRDGSRGAKKIFSVPCPSPVPVIPQRTRAPFRPLIRSSHGVSPSCSEATRRRARPFSSRPASFRFDGHHSWAAPLPRRAPLFRVRLRALADPILCGAAGDGAGLQPCPPATVEPPDQATDYNDDHDEPPPVV